MGPEPGLCPMCGPGLYSLEAVKIQFLHFRVQLKAGCVLQLMIMFTMILYSLENIRLRKETPQGGKIPLDQGRLKLQT